MEMSNDFFKNIMEMSNDFLKNIIGLLKTARCPNGGCDNNGIIMASTMGVNGLEESVQEQCQWCWERESVIDIIEEKVKVGNFFN